jgi:hypothetical protein
VDLTDYFDPGMIAYLRSELPFEDWLKTHDNFNPGAGLPRAEHDLIGRAYFTFVNEGPKVLVVSPALETVAGELDLKFTFPDYHQPYPSFLHRYPDGRSVLVGHHPRAETVTFHVWHTPGSRERATMLFRVGGLVRKSSFRDGDTPHDWHRLMWHSLVINTVLMYAGTCLRGWADEAAYRRSERSGRFRERNLALVAMKQEVDVMARLTRATGGGSAGKGGDEEEEGWSVHPHWRNAHLRLVRHGPGRTLRKLVLIDRVFVNKKWFGGDLTDTRVTYR